MTCKECSARRQLARDALLRSAMGEAVVHAVNGAAEMVGLKKKTASAELKKSKAKPSGAAGKPAKKAKTTAQE